MASSYRSVMVSGAVLATTLLLAGPFTGTAEAGKQSKRDVELVRPATAPDADASGVVRITTTKRGEKGVLKLRNLDPKTRYEVHDADTDEVLGVVRTNRRGKAKMKVHRKVRGTRGTAQKGAAFEVPDNIEICRLDDDAPLLLGDTGDRARDLPDIGELPEFGFAHYEGVDGWFAFVDMFSYADEQGFHLSLNAGPTERPDTDTDTDARAATGRDGGWNGAPIIWLAPDLYEYARDTVTGDELPLGVDTVAELSGRAFRVVDGDGAVLVRGVLPDLERPDWQRPDWQRPDWQRPDWQRPDWDDHDGDDDHWRSPPDVDFPTRPQPGDDERPTDAAGNSRGAAKMGGFPGGMPEFDFDFELPEFDHQVGDEIDFDDLMRMMPPEFMPFPMPEREASDLRLEIANDDGDLTDVGALDRIVFPEIDFPGFPGGVEFPFVECPMDGATSDESERNTATGR